jgi:hypothetical protein
VGNPDHLPRKRKGLAFPGHLEITTWDRGLAGDLEMALVGIFGKSGRVIREIAGDLEMAGDQGFPRRGKP